MPYAAQVKYSCCRGHAHLRLLQRCALIACGITALHSAAAAPAPFKTRLQLQLDLRNPRQRIYQVTEQIAVQPGELTLCYPKWIPGEHSPSGPLDAVAGLIVNTAAGQRVQWRRDEEDPFLIHLQVPPATASLQLQFELLSPATGGEFGHIVWAADGVQAVEWNQVLFYPRGPAAEVLVQPSVLLPSGWNFATALEVRGERQGVVEFAPVTLDQLVDSPLVTARYMARLDISPVGEPPAHLNLFAEAARTLTISAAQIGHIRSLVVRARQMLGPPHYEHYDFLLTLSDQLGSFGLEHAQSSDDRAPTRFLQDPQWTTARAFLLPHELAHSWNGKFRRPVGLATADFNTPMRGGLLWSYEGLTVYIGEVLAARAGLWSAAQYREYLARTAAIVAHRPGRSWRNLQDTADSGPMIYYSSGDWASQRRGTDFYEEGSLLWLDVDTRIRELSGDRRSLDDFTKLFFAGGSHQPSVSPYRLEDVIAALNQTQPSNWRGFLAERLDSHTAALPLTDIARGGWKLVYDAVPNVVMQANEHLRHLVDFSYSFGLVIDTSSKNAGQVIDVIWDSPAFQAGFAPGMKLLEVNQGKFDPERLEAVFKSSPDDRTPVQFVVENGDARITLTTRYRGDLRYPHLQRIQSVPDRITDIISSR